MFNFIYLYRRKKHSEDVDNSKPDVRFKSVMRVVQSFGEYEKLIGGVFENYLRIKFKDCYFESVCGLNLILVIFTIYLYYYAQILEGLSWANWFHDVCFIYEILRKIKITYLLFR